MKKIEMKETTSPLIDTEFINEGPTNGFGCGEIEFEIKIEYPISDIIGKRCSYKH